MPARTLVSVQHGAEWWTAWFLRTHIAQVDALRPEDWRRYDRILFLEIKAGAQANMFPGGGPPPGLGRGPAPGDSQLARADRGAQPMMSAPIPPDAEVLHEGATLKLARIATPPDFVVSRNPHSLPQ
jgi:hypothetical protein